MTQEDKELLLKDLCARLPYGVRVFVSGDEVGNGTTNEPLLKNVRIIKKLK